MNRCCIPGAPLTRREPALCFPSRGEKPLAEGANEGLKLGCLPAPKRSQHGGGAAGDVAQMMRRLDQIANVTRAYIVLLDGCDRFSRVEARIGPGGAPTSRPSHCQSLQRVATLSPSASNGSYSPSTVHEQPADRHGDLPILFQKASEWISPQAQLDCVLSQGTSRAATDLITAEKPHPSTQQSAFSTTRPSRDKRWRHVARAGALHTSTALRYSRNIALQPHGIGTVIRKPPCPRQHPQRTAHSLNPRSTTR